MKLTIELVPRTAWYTNVRSNVTKSEWDIIRKKCYRLAEYKCEICGGKGDKHPVECHEIWSFDDQGHVQQLTGLIALCPNCHKAKHVGLAQINGEEDIVINQLIKVNGCSKKEAINQIEEAFKLWVVRSQYEWQLDINYLNEYIKL